MIGANRPERGWITISLWHPVARQMKSSLRHFGFLVNAARKNSGRTQQKGRAIQVSKNQHLFGHLGRVRRLVKLVALIRRFALTPDWAISNGSSRSSAPEPGRLVMSQKCGTVVRQYFRGGHQCDRLAAAQKIQWRSARSKGGWDEKDLDADGKLPRGRQCFWACGI